MKKYAPAVLRIGLALVFLWFGTQQIFNTGMWTRMIPDYALNLTGLSAITLVHINGAFEIVFGICLLLGFFTRIVSFLLMLHIIHIVTVVGWGGTGVRDFGIAIGMVALFMTGTHSFALDNLFNKKTEVI